MESDAVQSVKCAKHIFKNDAYIARTITWPRCRKFIDDHILGTKTWDEHLLLLRDLLSRLKETNLTARPTKCKIEYFSLEFLEHKLSQRSMSPSEAKIETAERNAETRDKNAGPKFSRAYKLLSQILTEF